VLITIIVFLSGCVGETLYVCPTGEKVSDANLCPNNTPQPTQKAEVEKEYVCQNGEVVSKPSGCPQKTTSSTSTTMTSTSTFSKTLPTPSSTAISLTTLTTLVETTTTSSLTTTTTIPPPAPAPNIELVWEFKEPESESNLHDRDVSSVSVSGDDRYIGVYFGGGTNYILDETGSVYWSAKFEGDIDYALYRHDTISSYNSLTYIGPYNAFKILTNNVALLITDKIEMRNLENQPVGDSYQPKTQHTDRYTGINVAEITKRGTYAAVASFEGLSLHLVEISGSSINELWGYQTRRFAFYDFAVSDVPTVVAAQTDGWIGFIDESGTLKWNENLDTLFTGIDISADGRCIAAVDDKMTLYLLDNQGNMILKKILSGNIKDVAISSDCMHLYVGIDDRLEKYSINVFQDKSDELKKF